MVVATMPWLSGSTRFHLFHHDKLPPATLGILAFEAAKTMSRLVSLYKSLTDEEIFKLRKETMKSKGVAYLNSKDQGFLLNLACAERLEDLHLAAVTVSRLGQKSSDFGLNRFDLVYADLRIGMVDVRKLEFGTKNIEKLIDKMEKLIAATAKLYAALESLTELEVSEKKVQRWKKNLGPKHSSQANIEYFNDKISYQRKQVQHYKEVSLWNQTFDKSIGLMARIVCIVYARICVVFGPYISGFPSLSTKNVRSGLSLSLENSSCLLEHRELYRNNFLLIDQKEKFQERASKSGPIPKSGLTRFMRGEPTSKSGPIPSTSKVGFPSGEPNDSGIAGMGTTHNNSVFRLAPPSTVGGAGLSQRYANVVLFAERCFHAPATIGEDAREALYEMLPTTLKTMVRAKLRDNWLREEEEDESDGGHCLAEGWRDAMEEIMDWLSPLAHDTVRWQTERNLEKQRFDTKPTVLLLQTLHYSDLEKTEAAIVEVLVGLSCVYRYEKRRRNVSREVRRR
ncbi:putative Avr9/Cf-9 rapidly elicited protein [Quillaja saponaria]|uniref:Avr9/Cf-9 rapidly elicited protein n=1 Tax=Quillaja saponaria TaxID=32244 RepID=A0AAD7LNG4_QUISA|nr:putative Avr9/Cf-9 rapidly elicited protein [Quillaja saponaria]